MIAGGNGQFGMLLDQVAAMDSRLAEAIGEERSRAASEPENSYYSGETNRLNPVPAGVQPHGSDADYHYISDHSYYLIGERGRHAVRNNGLVEQGINRLCANLLLDFELDSDSGDKGLDRELKAKWDAWCENAAECDYEGERTFQQIANQSFFSQVQDGDIDHLPLKSGHIQTWENHHVRDPWGNPSVPPGSTLTHGVERRRGRVVAHWIADQGVRFQESGNSFTPKFSYIQSGRYQSKRYPVYDDAGNRQVFRLGFFHRFWQGRGISRLSPPRESMNGFERLNWSNIHSSVKRSLISYLMTYSGAQGGLPPKPMSDPSIPNSGARSTDSVSYTAADGSAALDTINIETPDGPAQVMKPPIGWGLQGWNANLPPAAFFEHASLMLTILSVNLDLPLMFLLLDGSKVNFHGGRMITDQVRLRYGLLQKTQISGLWNPTYQWKFRQWTTPGSEQFDPAIRRATESNLPTFRFRPRGWPYVKPLEDVTADAVAKDRRIRSMKRILAKYGIDETDHYEEVVSGEISMMEMAAGAAEQFVAQHPELGVDARTIFFRILDGGGSTEIKLNLSGAIGGDGDGEK